METDQVLNYIIIFSSPNMRVENRVIKTPFKGLIVNSIGVVGGRGLDGGHAELGGLLVA